LAYPAHGTPCSCGITAQNYADLNRINRSTQPWRRKRFGAAVDELLDKIG
jgi:hypothetical protein